MGIHVGHIVVLFKGPWGRIRQWTWSCDGSWGVLVKFSMSGKDILPAEAFGALGAGEGLLFRVLSRVSRVPSSLDL